MKRHVKWSQFVLILGLTFGFALMLQSSADAQRTWTSLPLSNTTETPTLTATATTTLVPTDTPTSPPTATSTTAPTETTTPTQEPCSAKTNKVERVDFANAQWVVYGGEELNVMPFERLVLRYDIGFNIPKNHRLRFSVNPQKWQPVSTFSPSEIEGAQTKTSFQYVYLRFTVPDSDPGNPQTPIVGNTFRVRIEWDCLTKQDVRVASGELGVLRFKGIPGPKTGEIRGKVTELRDHPCPHPATCPVKPLSDCIVQLLLSGVQVAGKVTDKAGDYTFANLLPGTYTVSVPGLCKGKNYKSQSKPAVVQSDTATQVDFQLEKEKK